MAIKLPKLPFNVPQVQLGPRARKIARYASLAFLGLIVFVFAIQCSFPYERVKDKAIEALQDKYDVSIGDVERGIWPGRVYFKAVSLRTRQTKPEDTVTTFYIEKLELNLGVLALLRGTIALDMDAKIGAGHLTGSLRVGKYGQGDIDASFEGDSLPGANLPMRAIVGLPMTGKIEFDVDLHLPVEKNKMGKTGINWQKVAGTISLGCPSGCTFGDGKTKLKPLVKNTRQQAMVADGIDFGKVTMESLAAKVTIKNAKLTLDKFDTKSRDGEIKIDYMMTLDRDFGNSMVTGCLRFKASDDLLAREPKTHAAISTTGAERRADGYFHIRLTDRFNDMKRLNQECGPGANPGGSGGGENFDRGGRPNLTVQPDQPVTPRVEPPPPPPIMMDGGMGSPTTAPPGQGMQEGGNPPTRMPPPRFGSGEAPQGSAGSGSAGSPSPPPPSAAPAPPQPAEGRID